MPGLRLIGRCRKLIVLMAMSAMSIMTGCSAKTPSADVIRPPAELLYPCIEPVNSGEALVWFSRGQYEKAAESHVRYVLDVRDAFELCNGRLEVLRNWYEDVSR